MRNPFCFFLAKAAMVRTGALSSKRSPRPRQTGCFAWSAVVAKQISIGKKGTLCVVGWLCQLQKERFMERGLIGAELGKYS